MIFCLFSTGRPLRADKQLYIRIPPWARYEARTWKPYRYPAPDRGGRSFPMGVHRVEYLVTLDLYDY